MHMDNEEQGFDLESELHAWIDEMRESGSTGGGALWPNLEPNEGQRRKAIIREFFPALIPLIACVTADRTRAEQLVQSESKTLRALHVQDVSEAFAYRAVASSIDLIATADGLNHEDVIETRSSLDEAIEGSISGAPSLTLPEIFGWSDRPRFLIDMGTVDDCRTSEPEGAGWTLACGRLAQSWGASPTAYEALAEDVDLHSWLIGNPMLDERLLNRVSVTLLDQYPSDQWEDLATLDPTCGPDMGELEEEDPEAFESFERLLGVPGMWVRALTNPMLSIGTLGKLWGKSEGHNLETPMLAAVLLHRSCPESLLRITYDSARQDMNWPLICIAANPATAPGILASMATLDPDEPIRIISELDVGVEDVLVAVALNPSTDSETCSRLQGCGIPRVSRALQARR